MTASTQTEATRCEGCGYSSRMPGGKCPMCDHVQGAATTTSGAGMLITFKPEAQS